jgi:hypothetical protein
MGRFACDHSSRFAWQGGGPSEAILHPGLLNAGEHCSQESSPNHDDSDRQLPPAAEQVLLP